MPQNMKKKFKNLTETGVSFGFGCQVREGETYPGSATC